jgi:hypothetical protein
MKKVRMNENQFKSYLKWMIKEEISLGFQRYVDMFVNELIDNKIDLHKAIDIGGNFGNKIVNQTLSLSDVFEDIKNYFFNTWLPEYNSTIIEYKVHEKQLWDELNNNWEKILEPLEYKAKEAEDIKLTEKALNRNFQ